MLTAMPRFSPDPYSTDYKWNTRNTQYNQTQAPPQENLQAAETTADQRTERLGGYSTGYGGGGSSLSVRGIDIPLDVGGLT